MAAPPTIIKLNIGDKVDKWTCTKKLGEGAFGAVYLVTGPGGEFALKAESAAEAVPLLRMEVKVMEELKKIGAKNYCELIDKGRFDNFNFIVMKLVGMSLQDAKKFGPDGHLSLGPAISVSIQTLQALEDLHWAKFLHRDVKPGNFATGRKEKGEQRLISVLDFGMCRQYATAANVIRHPRSAAVFRGTPRYAALASHNKKEHGRKDDIESWFYMLVDFTNAALPWKTVNAIPDVGRVKKESRSGDGLKLLLKDCPPEYADLLKHIDGLSYYDCPDYAMLKKSLRDIMAKHKAKEFPYDYEK